jgi:hypothetical protein
MIQQISERSVGFRYLALSALLGTAFLFFACATQQPRTKAAPANDIEKIFGKKMNEGPEYDAQGCTWEAVAIVGRGHMGFIRSCADKTNEFYDTNRVRICEDKKTWVECFRGAQ